MPDPAGSLWADGSLQALFRVGDIEIFNSEKTPRSQSGGVYHAGSRHGQTGPTQDFVMAVVRNGRAEGQAQQSGKNYGELGVVWVERGKVSVWFNSTCPLFLVSHWLEGFVQR